MASATDAGARSGLSTTHEIIVRAMERQTNTTRTPARDKCPIEKQLLKLTHLHMESQNINNITGDIKTDIPQLEVLYLYNNSITNLEHLGGLSQLTCLYLQQNRISDLSNLGALPNLQKLYLDNNQISLVTGLHECCRLEELHVSQQRLAPGVSLTFDHNCMSSVFRTLRVLTASHNNITDVDPLAPLVRCSKLDLSSNKITNVEQLKEALGGMQYLHTLDLRGNPVCRSAKYRDNVILAADSVVVLDGEEVPASHREFLLNLMINKVKMQMKLDSHGDVQQAGSSVQHATDDQQGDARTGSSGFQHFADAGLSEAAEAVGIRAASARLRSLSRKNAASAQPAGTAPPVVHLKNLEFDFGGGLGGR